MVASSADAGKTWTYTIDNQTSPSVPAGFTNSGYFNSANCNGFICVATGYYLGGSNQPYIQYPLIASSTDGGASWKYTLDSAQPTRPSDYYTAGVFYSASAN